MGDGLAELMRCTSCGAEVAPTGKFCPECGTARADGTASPAPSATAVPGASMTGERRQVTALFADLVGSTVLSQQVDLDAYAEAVLAYQEAGRAAITAAGGHVAVYLGDGVLGLFGYPVAHEDDALRAIRAGLDLLAGLNRVRAAHLAIDIRARVGIHTGLAIVGSLSETVRTDTAVFGDTINIAARVEAASATGTLTITETTHRLVRAHILATDLGPIELKGVLQPVRLHRVDGLRHTAVEPDWATPFVGRERELEDLWSLLAKVAAGAGRVVFVVGVAGLGKSRLVAEFESRLDMAPNRRWRATCSPTTFNTAYHPFVRMFERLAGVNASTTPDARRALLNDALVRWSSNEIGLRALLGIDDSGEADSMAPEALRAATRRSLVELLAHFTGRGPALLVVDDLHWADPSTRELLFGLSNDPIDGLLVVTTLRPEGLRDAPIPDVSVVIEVPPLSEADARRIARAAWVDVDEARLEEVLARSDGVPLFVEEITKAARHQPDLAVPTSLHDSLTARLDRLGPVRTIAQHAAVLGREFSRDDLFAVVAPVHDPAVFDGLLDELLRSGLVQSCNDNLMFRHALIHDAAYGSLLRGERERLHRRVAEHLLADEGRARPEEIAHHLAGANRCLDAARWYLVAGRRAAQRAAYREAIGHAQRGVSVASTADTTAATDAAARDRVELDLQLLIGNATQAVKGFGTTSNLAVWNRAIELADVLGDLDERTSAMNGLAICIYDKGDVAGARLVADDIVRRSEHGRSRAGRARGYTSVALMEMDAGQHRQAFEHAMRAVDEHEPDDFLVLSYGIGIDQAAGGHSVAGLAAWYVGEDRVAREKCEAGIALARGRNLASLALTLTLHAMMRWLRRDDAAAAAAADEVIRVSATLEAVQQRAFGLLLAGAVKCRRLRDGDGLAMIDEARALFRQASSLNGAPLGCAVLADAYLALDDHDRALSTADLGLELAKAAHQFSVDPELLRIRAAAKLALAARSDVLDPDVFAQVEADLRSAIATSRASGSLPFEVRAAIDLVRAHELLGTDVPIAPLRQALARTRPDDTSPDTMAAHALIDQHDRTHPLDRRHHRSEAHP